MTYVESIGKWGEKSKIYWVHTLKQPRDVDDAEVEAVWAT